MQPNKAKQLIANHCSRQERCSYDVIKKLERWELDPKDINEIMQFLYEYKFIDDTRYTEAYIQDKLNINHWGKQKITMMLKRKQISSLIINQSFDTINPTNFQEKCIELLNNKNKTLNEQDPYKRKAKLIRFALSRGFEYDIIQLSLSQINFT